MKTITGNPRFRSYLISYLILVFLVFSGAIYRFYELQKQLFRDADNQLLQFSRLKVQEINNWRKERIAEGQFLFRNASFNSTAYRLFKNNADSVTISDLRNWVEPIKSNHGYRAYIFAGTDGKIFLSSASAAEAVYADLFSYIDSVKKEEKIYFSALSINSVTGEPEFYCVLPLKYRAPGNDELFGIFAWIVDPSSELYEHVRSADYYSLPSTDVTLFRADNDSIYLLASLRSELYPAIKSLSLKSTEITATAGVQKGDGIYDGKDINGKDVIEAVNGITPLKIYISLKFEKSEIWSRILYNSIFSLVAIFSLLAGFGFYLRYLITNDERKNIEMTLAFEKQRLDMVRRFELVFESSDDIMMILDSSGKVLNLNRAGINKYGTKINGVDTYFSVTGEKNESNGLSGLLNGGFYETIHTAGDGSEFEVEVSSQKLTTTEGDIIFVIIRELTDRIRLLNEIKNLNLNLEKKVEERTAELKALNSELEAFTYSVSHDLRAPLRHITGFIEIFVRKYKSKLDEGGIRYLNIISESAKEMGRLIDNLLVFSRITRTTLKKVKTDINEIIKTAFNECAREYQGKDIEFIMAEFPEADVDPVMIKVVFTNLFSNALKYSSKKNPVRVETGYYNLGKEIVIFVKDNGAGFDMNYSDKLFRVFQRLHTQEEFEGSGIGLATVERIVSKHGGRVWADSVLKQGSVFYFSIPVVN